MKRSRTVDVLADPEIQRHTERIMALREEERQTLAKLGSIIAALSDEIAATLTPDALLTDPRTGRQVPLKEMSARSLDRALDALEGRTPPKKPNRLPVM